MEIQVELEALLGFGIFKCLSEKIMTADYLIEQLKITRNLFFNYI